MIPAPAKYNPYPDNADLVYDANCKVLSERQEQVNWEHLGPDEWQLLPQMAQAEGVGPLLYWNFKNENWPPGIPKEAAAALMGQYYTTLGHNTLLFRELSRILAALAEADIPVILLKGVDLAQTLYPDPALRLMGDLDLLVYS